MMILKKRICCVILTFALLLPGLVGGPSQLQATEIRIGMSAAFSGASKGLGIELYRGAMAYFDYINRMGGVNGHTIRLVAYDDGYDPIPAIENTIKFVEQDDVFCLFSYVGTPTVTRVLPLLKSYRERNIYMLFPFTGAQPQREFPYSDFVFNLRASYQQETAGIVENLIRNDYTRIAVFYQADAYGRSGWDGTRRELARHNLRIVGEATYRRGSTFAESFREQAAILKSAGADAVISIGAYAACAGFIRDARDLGWQVPIANVSFVDSQNMAALLQQAERKKGISYTERLINSQVVPCCGKTELPAVHEYYALMKASGQQLPPQYSHSDYQPHAVSPVSFEGFLNAKLLVEIIKRMGSRVNRSRLKPIIESINAYDVGIDVPISFGPQKHQALDSVYYTTMKDGQWASLQDWSVWHK